MTKTLKISRQSSGQRLDVFLAGQLKESRSQVQKLFTAGRVMVNQKIAKKHYLLKPGDLVKIGSEPRKTPGQPSEFTLRIIRDTADYLVIDKPSGLIVHADNTHPMSGSLAGLIINKYPEIAGIGDSSLRPGVVHRLDKNVSGVMVVARTQEMFAYLKRRHCPPIRFMR